MTAGMRKLIADMTLRKGRTLLIIIGILVGVFGLTSINLTKDMLFSAYTYTIENQATQPDITMLVDKPDPSLIHTLQAVSNVKAIQFDTRVSTLWRISSAPGYTPIKIISYPDIKNQTATTMNPFELVSGRYPQVGEIVMEYGDTALASFNIGDTVSIDTLHGKTRLRVVGMTRTAGANPATSGKAQAYMSDAGMHQLDVLTNSDEPNHPSRQFLQRTSQKAPSIHGGGMNGSSLLTTIRTFVILS